MKGPTFNNETSLELITAPYTDNIQVKMPSDMFTSISNIDYFIVYVGNGIDCRK